LDMADNFWLAPEVLEKARKAEDGRDEKHNINYTFLHRGEHCTLNAVQMADNIHGIPLHIHKDHDEIIQLLEGEGEVVIGDQKRILKRGDVFFVPKGTPHALRFGCIILSIYAPAFDTNNPDRIFLE
jgi:quercetin dioxygenase-like cupin family protein